MKPESKKNRGKAGASSAADTQDNGVESCYDFSNLSNALSVIAPAAANPTGSSSISATRKDGGSSSLAAYDFRDFAKELSSIEHKEKKLAALRSRSHRKREHHFRTRRVSLDTVMFSPPAMLGDGVALRPSLRLRNHPLVDFPLAAMDWPGVMDGGLSTWSVERPVVEEVKEDESQVSNPAAAAAAAAAAGGSIPVLGERPYPIMYRLSRIVSLCNRRRRRHYHY